MSELDRSATLIERLLGEPELRRKFRADPAGVLVDAGLPRLAAEVAEGDRALMTLDRRESRSSLAGVMIAAAAEGVDLAQLAEHAAPALAHDADQAIERLMAHPHHHQPAHHAPAKPAAGPPPSLGPAVASAKLAPEPQAHSASPEAPAASGPEPQADSATPAAPANQPAPAGPAASASDGHAATNTPVSPTNQPTGPAAQTGTGGAALAGGHHHAGTPGTGGASLAGGHDHPGTSGAGSHASQPTSGVEPPAPAPEPSDALPYPGDQAPPQALAAWMAAGAQRAGLPPELPVMAALTESGLRNLPYGDRDSVGFFQMRLSIWDEGPYAGYPNHPQLQLQWFIDHALAVRAQNPALAASPNSWGEWVADIEQPAAQYRYRYQLELGPAQELLNGANLAPTASAPAPVSVGQAALNAALHHVHHGHDGASSQAGTATSAPGTATPAPGSKTPAPGSTTPAPGSTTPAPGSTTPAPGSTTPAPGSTAPAPSTADAVPAAGSGSAPAAATDSAALVQSVYARQNVQLPGAAVEQFDVGIPVPRDGLRPGDAVFFGQPGGLIDRVGLYAGHGRFVSAVPGSGAVKMHSLDDPGIGEYVGARRYTAQALGNPTSYARPLPTIKHLKHDGIENAITGTANHHDKVASTQQTVSDTTAEAPSGAGTDTSTTEATNPFPGGWAPGRADMGYDGTFTGQIVAPMSGTITYASNSFSNWGGYLQLKTDAAFGQPSQTFYFAEGLSPTVAAGQHVIAGQPIAVSARSPWNGESGNIEWGLAQDPPSVGTPTNPIAEGASDGPSLVLNFLNWAERALRLPAPSSTGHAGYP